MGEEKLKAKGTDEYSLRPVYAELEEWTEALIQNNFGGKLPMPVIVIGKMGKNNLPDEECPSEPVWRKKGGGEKDKGRYEIKVSAIDLSHSKEKVAEIILHELVHYYCRLHRIKDTNKNRFYHNQKFMENATQHGLSVTEKDKRYGWSNTHLSDETKAFLKSKFGDAVNTGFPIYRILEQKKDDKESRPKRVYYTRKYVCECGQVVMSVPNAAIICGKCNNRFSPSKGIKKTDAGQEDSSESSATVEAPQRAPSE